MISRSMPALVEVTLAASAAVLFVAALRVPVRRAVGARAAYWLWLSVPASVLAVLLPAPLHALRIPAAAVPRSVGQIVATAALGDTCPSTGHTGLLIWAVGAAFMLAAVAWRQGEFVRSLGRLSLLPDGAYRSAAVSEPMLVGAWRPRIVLPADLEARYTREECELILAHERAHLERGDGLHNALATLALCLSWFNPLMYWAIARFRLDQELACDALVLGATGTACRRYADTLLKAQLRAGRLPDNLLAAPCRWRTHPLKERIAEFGRPLPGGSRRTFGVALALGLSGAASFGVWSMQLEPQIIEIPASARPVLTTPAIDMAIPAFEFEIPSAPATPPFAAGMRAGPAVQCPVSRHRSGTKT
jgi:bla regulator protein blaR1